ncbi:hypothetical protein FMN12_22315, partial [Bacteroides acidifaciens]|nr:hypothetical protein [Bacteroides acidifaciens]
MFSNHLYWNGKLLLLILVVGLLSSCSQSQKAFLADKYSDFPKEKELRGEVIELDTALFRYP